MDVDLTLERELRAATFDWLEAQTAVHGSVLPARLLRLGFEFRGQPVPLAVQQGIHKPKFVTAALTLRTSLSSKYDDHFVDEETLVYSYQGTDPNQWDNRAARAAYQNSLPLVYLHAVAKSRYAVIWPIFITGDDPAGLTFRLQAGVPAADALTRALSSTVSESSDAAAIERAYATRLVRTRIHQATFRERVLSAYREQCAMCHFKHTDLLDAAHITPDSDPMGEPVVSNGLALCKMHHGAFDLHYLSVDPESYRIHIRPSLLDEEDGPMLRHGLQGLEGEPLLLPRRVAERPDRERLARHWLRFSSSSTAC